MMKVLVGSLFLFLFMSRDNEAALHPFHVSNTEISYNAPDKNLEIICRIFTDDFEKALGLYLKQKADFTDPKLESRMDQMVRDYMKTHLAITADSKRLSPRYIGYEVEKEAVNVYLEHALPAAPKRVEVQNTLVYEAYDDQVGIVHVIINGRRITNKITYPDKGLTFEF